MAAKFETCDIPGLRIITPDVYADARGWFTEAYHAQRYFENGVKPLIMNKTNMAATEKATGTPFIDEWVGHKLQLYVTTVSAFGEVTMAVRVRDFSPQA